ncbi:hypothetical protein [Micrococcoides hystricis]|uniref:DUF8083 domain-containing protein n=1 Tax=Micrococcoides hystricis TaxID=1572761 RepID=A0ABV6PAI2_9MICC
MTDSSSTGSPAVIPPQQMLPAVSWLRVYQPLHAFSDEQQLHIKAQRLGREQVEQAEAERILHRILVSGENPYPTSADEFVREVSFPSDAIDATDYFCPNSFAPLSYLAAEELAEEILQPLFSDFIPEPARLNQQDRYGSEPEEAHQAAAAELHCRFALANIPLAWFVPFHRTDETEVLQDEHDGKVQIRGMRVRVALFDARERVKKACSIMALHAPDLPLLEDLMELSQWFEQFHQDSVVELDYGNLARYVYPDDSLDDIQAGLEALSEGDMTAVAAAHRRLSLRWGPAQFLPRLN